MARYRKWSWSSLRPASSFAVPDFSQRSRACLEEINDLVCGHVKLLNGNQCRSLTAKLMEVAQNVQQMVDASGRSKDEFSLSLQELLRIIEKAKILVKNCCCEEWCQAAALQIQNKESFRKIILELGLCYNVIYEHWDHGIRKEWNGEDLRQSSTFLPTTEEEVLKDEQVLYVRLEDLAKAKNIPSRLTQSQCLAKYLLGRLNAIFKNSKPEDLDTSFSNLWANGDGPVHMWGESFYLGSGSCQGGVCRTTWNGIPCAKKIFQGRVDEQSFRREASILSSLSHPNIVKFYCCNIDQKKRECFIAMELMDRSLQDVIHELTENRKGAQFSLPVSVDIMLQIAYGMCYLHDTGVAHRDLKPSNVVVRWDTAPQRDKYLCAKLVDFGLSKTKVTASAINTISIPGVGTTLYRAPEAFPQDSGKSNALKADVYSYALTCSEILSGKAPFEGILRRDLYAAIKHGERPVLPANCPEELGTLLRQCWSTEPSERPSFFNICTRLEVIKYNMLRELSQSDQSPQHKMPGPYIQQMLKKHSRMRLGSLQLDEGTTDTMNEYEDYVIVKKGEEELPTYLYIHSEDIIIGKSFDIGVHGHVHEASWLDGKFFVKLLRTSNIRSLQTAVKVMTEFPHPHVVQFVGYSVEKNTIMILVERMDGDLHHFIQYCLQGPPFKLDVAVDILLQIAKGMAYLHSEGVIQKVLKAANVWVNFKAVPHVIHVKISRFALTQQYSNVFSDLCFSEAEENLRWQAPEVFPLRNRGMLNMETHQRDATEKELMYTKMADVYSFAMTCYEVLTGETPFATTTLPSLYEKIVTGYRPELPMNIPSRLSSLTRACWDNDPKRRPSFLCICKALFKINDRIHSLQFLAHFL